MPQLQRKMGLWGSISIVAGSIIGTSIFMKPAAMASQLGSPVGLLLVWVAAGLVTLIGGMINAEVGCVLPETGGQYIYFRRMYGDFFAYLYGWACFIVINSASIAGIAFVFGGYMEYFFPLPHFSPGVEHAIALTIPGVGRFYLLGQASVKALAIGLILILTWINVRSVKAAVGVQVFFSFLKVGALIILVSALFFSGKGHLGNLTHTPAGFDFSAWALLIGFVAATTGALAGYDGWNSLGYVAGEIKNPARNIPRGLIIGISVCVLLYALTNEAYLYIMPVETMKHSPLVASDAMRQVWGVAGGGFIALLIMCSSLGATNSCVLPCARLIYAMGEERSFFSWTGKVNGKFHTPANALWLQALWSVLLVLLGSFDMLMDMFVFITWIFYAFAAWGIFILRKKMPDAERPYKLKGYPYLPLIFIAFAVIYIIVTLYHDIQDFRTGKATIINSVFGLVLTAAGIPLYWYFKRSNRISDAQSKPLL